MAATGEQQTTAVRTAWLILSLASSLRTLMQGLHQGLHSNLPGKQTGVGTEKRVVAC